MIHIEIEVWKPCPDKPGTVILDYRRVIHDVLEELNAKLTLEGVEPDEYGFSNMTKYDDPAYTSSYRDYSLRWPAGRLAVFPVTGGSEGHYIHITVIDKDTQVSTTIGLAKTFQGWDHACRISATAARLLQA